MAEHIWTVLCEHVITDTQTNSCSYLVAIEEIQVQALPVTVRMTLGSLWVREGDGDQGCDVRYRIAKPSGALIEMATVPVGKDKPRHRVNLVMEFTVEEEGIYYFQVDAKRAGRWRHAARVPLVVKVSGEQAAQSQ